MRAALVSPDDEIPRWLAKDGNRHGLVDDAGNLVALVESEKLARALAGKGVPTEGAAARLAAVMELHTEDSEYPGHCTTCITIYEDMAEWPCATAVAFGVVLP